MRKIGTAVVAVILVGACTPKGPSGQVPGSSLASPEVLDNATAIPILAAHEHLVCDPLTFAIGGGIGSGQYAQVTQNLYQWVEAQLGNRDLYTQTYGDQMERDYRYVDDGYSYRIKYVNFMGNSPVESQSIQLTFCPFVGDQINIEDKTPDASNPKLVTVTYTVTTRPTRFGAVFLSTLAPNSADVTINGTTWAQNNLTPTTKEYKATLQRLDESGWRLASGHPSSFENGNIWVSPIS